MAIELDEIINEMLEYARHLPGDEQVPKEILVLKGHLLIERQLMALIERKSAEPGALNNFRLTFKNKLHLVEALYGDIGTITWKHLHDLNSIRNSMAHELEDELVSPRIKKFVQSVGGDNLQYVEGGVLDQLAYCISHLHLELVKARDK